MAEVVQGLLFRARSNTQGATRDLRGIISIMADLNGAISLVQRGLAGMTTIFREGVGAAIEQERVFLRLDRSLQGLGTSYAESQERLSAYFAEVQRTTRFGDDATAAVMSRVATAVSSLDVGVDQLEEMTSLVLDYSEATGRDATTAAEALSKAFGGNVEALAEMLPSQRDLIREIARLPDAAERSAAAVALMSQEFGGAAQNIDPLELAFTRITNGMGDLREALGDLVRRSPAIQSVFSQIADTIDVIASALGGGSTAADGFLMALEDVTVGGTQYIRALGEQLVNLWRLAKQVSTEAQNLFGVGAGEERDRNEALNAAARSITQARDTGSQRDEIAAILAAERSGAIPAGSAASIPDDRAMARARINEIVAELERQREASGFRLGAQVEEEQAIDRALAQLASSIGRGGGMLDASGNPVFTPRDRGGVGGDGGGGGTGGTSSDPAAALAAAMSGVGGGIGAGVGAAQGKVKPSSVSRASIFDLDPAKLTESESMIVSAFDNITAAAMSFGDVSADVWDRALPAMDAYSARMAEMQAISEGFGAAMQTMVGDAAADALMDLTDAMIAGGDGMEGFGKRALSNLARMARGIGATYIATGIPMLLPGPLFNPAAGAAYMKYGGILLGGGTILGSLSGGGGGGGGSGGTVPEQSMRASSQARPIERTTIEATYIDTVVTSDERTYRALTGEIRRQDSLGAGRL